MYRTDHILLYNAVNCGEVRNPDTLTGRVPGKLTVDNKSR